MMSCFKQNVLWLPLYLLVWVFIVVAIPFANAQNTSSDDLFKITDSLCRCDLKTAYQIIDSVERQNNESYLGYREQLMFNKACLAEHLGYSVEADSLLSALTRLGIKNSSPEFRARFFLLKSKAFQLLGNFSEAALQLNQAESIYEELNDKAGLYNIGLQYVQLYADIDDCHKALNYLNNALEKENYVSVTDHFNLLYEKADLLRCIKQNAESYAVLEALSVLVNSGLGDEQKGKQQMAYANYYVAAQNFEQAIKNFKAAEVLFLKNNDLRNLYAVYSGMSVIYAQEQDHSKHLVFLRKAYKMAQQLGDVHLIFDGKLNLAKVFFADTQIDSAKLYTLSILENAPYSYLQMQAFDLLKSIYTSKHQYKKALETMEWRKRVSDSLKSSEVDRALEASKFDKNISQFEEKKVKIENEIHFRQLEHQNHFLVIRLVLLLMLFLLLSGIGLYFLLKARNKRKNSLLFHKLIFLQLNAHFVFNSLTAIQSLILKNKVVIAEHYLHLFADLMQYILKSSTQINVPLHEELSFQMAYLQLQKLRFEEELKYELNISDSVDPQHDMLPPFLIYPYLELAIETYIQKKGATGTIGLYYKKENNLLVIELEDKGIGFLADSNAYLQRPGQGHISLEELTKGRISGLNSFFRKDYKIWLFTVSEQNVEKRILQLKIRMR